MSALCRTSRRSVPWLAAVVLVAAAARLPGTARGQDVPKLYLGVIATESDATDKKAAEKAKKYLDELKEAKDEDPAKTDEAARAKAGRPPAFKNPPLPRPNLAAAAGAAAIPQVGLGDGLLAFALTNLPTKKDADAKDQLPFRYFWAQLKDRELTILDLDEDGSQVTKAATARDKGEFFIPEKYKFIIFSRKRGKGIDYFALIRQPVSDETVTHQQLRDIRKLDDTAFFVRFNAEGADGLKNFTKTNKDHFMGLVAEDKLLMISRVGREINDGQIPLSERGGFRPSELQEIITAIRRVTPAPR